MEIITTKINIMKTKKATLNTDYGTDLTKGKDYKIQKEHPGCYVILDDIGDVRFVNKLNFDEPKPVKNKSKKAKKIKTVTCTSKNYVDSECLTIDKKYLVLGESKICYQIIDDNSNEFYYPKAYFKLVKNKSKKAKKVKELRAFFNVSVDALEWCKNIVVQKGNIPEPLNKMHNLNSIALEEVNKEKPSMRRIKFLISEMESLKEQTIKY